MVFFAADKGHGKSLGSKSSSAADSVEVRVTIDRHVKVEDDVNLLDIDTATENFSGDQDTVLELLATFVDLDAFFLEEIAVDSLSWESVFVQNFSKFDGVLNTLDEDDNLVKGELIDEVDEFGDLIAVFKLHVVLLETVER